MFKFNRHALVAAVVAMIMAFPASGAAPATPSQALVTDCTKLPVGNTSLAVYHAGDFRKKGNTYRQVSTYIEGIPAGYTIWELLSNGGQCYMHSLSGNTPISGGTLSLGGSIAKEDIVNLKLNFTDSRLFYVILVAGPDDSKNLERFAHDGSMPAPDRLVTEFGSDTRRVNRDLIDVTPWY